MAALYHRVNPAGQNGQSFTHADPFDELASSHHKAAAPPALAPDSTHSPLGLDPLAHLWRPESGGADLLGIGSTSQPTAPASTSNGSYSRKVSDPWDIFDLPPPQQTHKAHQSTTSQPHRATGTVSTGDLLQLYDDEPHSSQNRARSPSPVAHDRGVHGSASTPEMQQGNGDSQAQGSESVSTSSTPGPQGAGAANDGTEQRELFIYALPLGKEKLVFLPIRGWQEEPKPPPQGVTGSFQAGINKLQESVTNMWTSMGQKDPGTLQAKIHAHGQAVLENMSAEERLMRYIPKAATKVIVYHPACIMPSEVQDQLQKMTSNFMVKATGKAAAAGLLLPVAVGIEMIAVPGTGWYALYQLYKSSVSVKGGNRLNQYLNHASNVRVCYAGMEKLDTYVERARLSPDGLLTQDDVDDLCHELEEPGLQHPLTELRNRYLKRIQNKSGDYAMLPTNDAADSDTNRTGTGSPAPTANTNKGLFTFWK